MVYLALALAWAAIGCLGWINAVNKLDSQFPNQPSSWTDWSMYLMFFNAAVAGPFVWIVR